MSTLDPHATAGGLRATVRPVSVGQASVGQGIVTPEAVLLDIERAGVASRILAMTMDAIVLGVIYGVLALITVGLVGDVEGVAVAVLTVVFSLGLYLGYFCAFETILQRTPGKAIFGLRVIALDGTPVRFSQAFLRVLVGVPEFFVIPVGFIAVVTTLLTPSDQRLGDLAAGTLVVRERSASSFVAPAFFPAPPGYEAYVGSLDVEAMTVEQYGLIRTFLLRAHQLAPLARIQMAVRLANPLATKVLHHQPPHYLHPETFLVCVAAAWQRTHATRRL
jgi:uncharacterized RDD family membrane protein YckC